MYSQAWLDLRHHGFVLPRQSAGPTLLAPPGVTPNYDNPHTISNQVVVVSLTLMVFANIFVGTRLGIKWRIVKKWGWDDGQSLSEVMALKTPLT